MRRRQPFSLLPLLVLGLAFGQVATALGHQGGKGHLRSRQGHTNGIRKEKRQLDLGLGIDIIAAVGPPTVVTSSTSSSVSSTDPLAASSTASTLSSSSVTEPPSSSVEAVGSAASTVAASDSADAVSAEEAQASSSTSEVAPSSSAVASSEPASSAGEPTSQIASTSEPATSEPASSSDAVSSASAPESAVASTGGASTSEVAASSASVESVAPATSTSPDVSSAPQSEPSPSPSQTAQSNEERPATATEASASASESASNQRSLGTKRLHGRQEPDQVTGAPAAAAAPDGPPIDPALSANPGASNPPAPPDGSSQVAPANSDVPIQPQESPATPPESIVGQTSVGDPASPASSQGESTNAAAGSPSSVWSEPPAPSTIVSEGSPTSPASDVGPTSTPETSPSSAGPSSVWSSPTTDPITSDGQSGPSSIWSSVATDPVPSDGQPSSSSPIPGVEASPVGSPTTDWNSAITTGAVTSDGAVSAWNDTAITDMAVSTNITSIAPSPTSTPPDAALPINTTIPLSSIWSSSSESSSSSPSVGVETSVLTDPAVVSTLESTGAAASNLASSIGNATTFGQSGVTSPGEVIPSAVSTFGPVSSVITSGVPAAETSVLSTIFNGAHGINSTLASIPSPSIGIPAAILEPGIGSSIVTSVVSSAATNVLGNSHSNTTIAVLGDSTAIIPISMPGDGTNSPLAANGSVIITSTPGVPVGSEVLDGPSSIPAPVVTGMPLGDKSLNTTLVPISGEPSTINDSASSSITLSLAQKGVNGATESPSPTVPPEGATGVSSVIPAFPVASTGPDGLPISANASDISIPGVPDPSALPSALSTSYGLDGSAITTILLAPSTPSSIPGITDALGQSTVVAAPSLGPDGLPIASSVAGSSNSSSITDFSSAAQTTALATSLGLGNTALAADSSALPSSIISSNATLANGTVVSTSYDANGSPITIAAASTGSSVIPTAPLGSTAISAGPDGVPITMNVTAGAFGATGVPIAASPAGADATQPLVSGLSSAISSLAGSGIDPLSSAAALTDALGNPIVSGPTSSPLTGFTTGTDNLPTPVVPLSTVYGSDGSPIPTVALSTSYGPDGQPTPILASAITSGQTAVGGFTAGPDGLSTPVVPISTIHGQDGVPTPIYPTVVSVLPDGVPTPTTLVTSLNATGTGGTATGPDGSIITALPFVNSTSGAVSFTAGADGLSTPISVVLLSTSYGADGSPTPVIPLPTSLITSAAMSTSWGPDGLPTPTTLYGNPTSLPPVFGSDGAISTYIAVTSTSWGPDGLPTPTTIPGSTASPLPVSGSDGAISSAATGINGADTFIPGSGVSAEPDGAYTAWTSQATALNAGQAGLANGTNPIGVPFGVSTAVPSGGSINPNDPALQFVSTPSNSWDTPSTSWSESGAWTSPAPTYPGDPISTSISSFSSSSISSFIPQDSSLSSQVSAHQDPGPDAPSAESSAPATMESAIPTSDVAATSAVVTENPASSATPTEAPSGAESAASPDSATSAPETSVAPASSDSPAPVESALSSVVSDLLPAPSSEASSASSDVPASPDAATSTTEVISTSEAAQPTSSPEPEAAPTSAPPSEVSEVASTSSEILPSSEVPVISAPSDVVSSILQQSSDVPSPTSSPIEPSSEVPAVTSSPIEQSSYVPTSEAVSSYSPSSQVFASSEASSTEATVESTPTYVQSTSEAVPTSTQSTSEAAQSSVQPVVPSASEEASSTEVSVEQPSSTTDREVPWQTITLSESNASSAQATGSPSANATGEASGISSAASSSETGFSSDPLESPTADRSVESVTSTPASTGSQATTFTDASTSSTSTYMAYTPSASGLIVAGSRSASESSASSTSESISSEASTDFATGTPTTQSAELPSVASIPSSIPTLIVPANSAIRQQNAGTGNENDPLKDNTLISLLLNGEQYPWVFVVNTSDATSQLFNTFPTLISSALQIDISQVKTYGLAVYQPATWTGNQDDLLTQWLAYIPSDQFETLNAYVKTPNSPLYAQSGIQGQLARQINTAFPLAASNTVPNPQASVDSSGSGSTRNRDIIIGVCVSVGGLLWLALVVWIYRRVKRSNEMAVHRRLSEHMSMFNDRPDSRPVSLAPSMVDGRPSSFYASPIENERAMQRQQARDSYNMAAESSNHSYPSNDSTQGHWQQNPPQNTRPVSGNPFDDMVAKSYVQTSASGRNLARRSAVPVNKGQIGQPTLQGSSLEFREYNH